MAKPGVCSICGNQGANYFQGKEDEHIGTFAHIACLIAGSVGERTELKPWTRGKAQGYLAGMIDGEGHVRKDSGVCEIANNDISIIAATKEAAEFLGFQTSVRVAVNKQGYDPTFSLTLLGGKKTRRKLLRLPIVSHSKRQRLGQ